jgi:hypothetical protein
MLIKEEAPMISALVLQTRHKKIYMHICFENKYGEEQILYLVYLSAPSSPGHGIF